MKLFSKYLMREVEINCEKVNDGGNELLLIPHSALIELIYHDQMCRSNGVKVSFHESPSNNARHHVWSCVISDNAGYSVEEIGESTYASLSTTIAQAYPSLTAHKRAFDAAALVFLHFPSALKIYSDEQIAEVKNANEAMAAELKEAGCEDVGENTPALSTVTSAPVTMPTPIPTPTPTPMATTAVPSAASKANEPSIDTTLELESMDESSSSAAALKEIVGENPPTEMWQEGNVDLSKFDTLITFGQYKGKSVKEIYAVNAKYIAYLVNKARDPELRQICADYLEYAKAQGI